MDLPATYARARGRLDSANDDFEARKAIERFVASFGDGHLELTWPRAVSNSPAFSASTASPPICDRLGFRGPDQYSVVARLPNYEPSDPQAPNAAGVLRVGTKRVAVLRVEEFGPGLSDCDRALKELRIRPTSACDDKCGGGIRARADDIFVVGFQRRLKQLADSQPDVMLIDLAGNGGGNDSAIALAWMLGGDVPTPSIARVRGKDLVDDIADKRASLAKNHQSRE